MSYQDDDYLNDAEEYYDDQSEPIEIDNDANIGKYEFLMKSDIEKERNKKIQEFTDYSSLSKQQAELVLIYYNWNLDILMNEWFDKTQKIKENCGLSQTKESQKKIDKFFQKIRLIKTFVQFVIIKLNKGMKYF